MPLETELGWEIYDEVTGDVSNIVFVGPQAHLAATHCAARWNAMLQGMIDGTVPVKPPPDTFPEEWLQP